MTTIVETVEPYPTAVITVGKHRRKGDPEGVYWEHMRHPNKMNHEMLYPSYVWNVHVRSDRTNANHRRGS